MTHLKIHGDPSRASLRREQVLKAAARCFTRRGFHSTSIAQIGTEAGMSVGHIYRYFINKEAIIAGIVQQNVDDALASFSQIEHESTDIQATLIACADRGVDKARDPDHAMLMIEVKAEAARNPKLAAILQAADAEIRTHLSRVLKRAVAEDWTQADVDMRAEMLVLMFEGLPLRIIANPDLDREALVRMMRQMLACILQWPPAAL